MIQIDIPMPKSCNECPIRGETFHCCPLVEGVPEWQREISENCKDKRSEHCPLKEQEAKPVEVCGQMFTVKYGNCPKCGEGMNSYTYPHWCGFCGQAVKLNEID